MYTKYYNLKEQPFNLTPDSHFLYLSTQHRDALGHLLYGIRERKGFMLVSGEVGTGKTTLCRALIKEIEKEAEVGFILNSFVSVKELLKSINEDLSCHRGGRSTKELVDELNVFLLQQHAAGRTVVLLLDECQNLALPVLEQLRMLSNLETEKEKLLQIIMVGQSELIDKLERRELRQLAQRISVTYHLKPLTYREAVRYIMHRLSVAGGGNGATGGPPLAVRFTRAALRRIYLYAEGIPRKINIICDRALLVGYVRGRKKITDSVVREALLEIQKHPRAARHQRISSGARLVAAVAAVACGVLAALYLYYPRATPALHRTPEKAPPVHAPARAGGEDHGDRPSAPVSNEAAAALLLARLWGTGGVSPAMLVGETDPASLAAGCGMKALECWADSRFLKALNIPCMVKGAWGQDGATIPAVLTSLEDGNAVLALAGGREIRIRESELDAKLRGRVAYFCPPTVQCPGILIQGMSGPQVSELQRNLKGAGLLENDENGWYGPATVAAVKRLQERVGVPADGVAGISECIAMRGMAAAGVPRLSTLTR